MSDINLTSSDSTSEDEYEVERIVDHRKVGKKLQYYIKWKDYSDEDNTWESEANVFATSLINEYWTDRGGREGMEAARKGKKLQKSKTTTSKGKQRKLPKAASKLSSSSSSSFSSSSSSYAPSSFTLASKRTRTPDVSQSVDKITEESSQGSVKRARTGSTQGGNDMVINEVPETDGTSLLPSLSTAKQQEPTVPSPLHTLASKSQPESSAPKSISPSQGDKQQQLATILSTIETESSSTHHEEQSLSTENEITISSEKETDINKSGDVENESIVAEEMIQETEKENNLFGNQNENVFDTETISPSLLETIPKDSTTTTLIENDKTPSNTITTEKEGLSSVEESISTTEKQQSKNLKVTEQENNTQKSYIPETNTSRSDRADNNGDLWDQDIGKTAREQQEDLSTTAKGIMLSPSSSQQHETISSFNSSFENIIDKENIAQKDNKENGRDLIDDILDEPTSVVSPGTLDDVMFDIMSQERYSLTPPVADGILGTTGSRIPTVDGKQDQQLEATDNVSTEEQQPAATNTFSESEKENEYHTMKDITTTTASATKSAADLEKDTVALEDVVTRIVSFNSVKMKKLSEINLDDVIYDDNFPESQEDWINVKEVVTVTKVPPENPDSEVFVVIRWNNDILSMHPSQDIRKYCARQLIDFYEKSIKFDR